MMNANSQGLINSLFDFLSQESSLLLDACFSGSSTFSCGASGETIHPVLQVCVVGYGLLSISCLQCVRQRDHLLHTLDRLREGLRGSMLHHEKRRELINAYQDIIGPSVGHLGDFTSGENPLIAGIVAVSQGLDQQFWERTKSASPAIDGTNNSLEEMDLDKDFSSQAGQRDVSEQASSPIHDNMAMCSSIDAFRASMKARICFASGQNATSAKEFQSDPTKASHMIRYFTSLRRYDFMLCSSVVRELLASDFLLSEDDADTLLQYMQQVILKPYELEKSEVSISLCIDILVDLAHLWTAQDSGDIGTTGAELYVWFITEVLDIGRISPHVLSRAAKLLHRIITLCPDYAKRLSLPSARTTLFKVLHDGNLTVKYTIGCSISDIFGLFVLKEHDNILEDIIESLPSDPTWIEGIALRLVVLAYLAASWPTLLRRCIYAIFETAGLVADVSMYARRCLENVTNTLQLAKSQELFRLFAPQLFYTWLETQTLNTMPFKIFGYDSLGGLLRDVHDEAVGQVIVRGRNEEAAQLAAEIGITLRALIETSFSKVATYSVARDVAVPPAEGLPNSHAETRLRKIVGRENYRSLVDANFADIVACLYTSMDYEDQFYKFLQKHKVHSKAHTAYQEILSISASDKDLPPNQQPSFKAKHLVVEIEHFCRRTSRDPESMWSPALYVYVFRQIINTTHPALGSLHACSVLRKIRILICMAGTIALEGYPLEMGLHALRPFLTDAQCCDDAVGLVQYLLHRGASYLGEVPCLLLGNAVTILTSMQDFLASAQDSTTQESQFRATILKAQSFHAWLLSFLNRYTSHHLSGEGFASFKTIVSAASHLLQGGSARKGSLGSELLVALLEDHRSGRHLLSQSSREIVLEFLSSSFQLPSNFREDILGDDSQAAWYASTIWETCQWNSASANYLLWSGRALGRAYVGQGHVDLDIIREISLESGHRSRVQILRLLSDLLTRDSRQVVGLAEMALRSIVTESHRTEFDQECENCLNPHLVKAMLWKDDRCPALPDPSLDILHEEVLNSDAVPRKNEAARDWVQHMCQALTIKAIGDPLMAPLSHVLRTIDDLAEKVFPYLLHLVLLKESGGQENTRKTVSGLCRQTFELCMVGEANGHATEILLNAVLNLRTQPMPHESTKSDRSLWLDLDYRQAAYAANQCSLPKTALMLLEIDDSVKTKIDVTSRRKSKSRHEVGDLPNDLLLEIFKNIDEQDAFYGVKQPSNLSSMMSQLEHEHAGFKSLSFRGAHYDGEIRHASGIIDVDTEGMIRALNSLDLNGLSQPLISKITGAGSGSVDAALDTARKLEQWDVLPPTSYTSSARTTFEVYQKINNATDALHLTAALNTGFQDAMQQLLADRSAKSSVHSKLGTLAILTEAEEIFSSRKLDQIEEVVARFQIRNGGMQAER